MAYKVLITFLEEHDDYYLEDMFDTEAEAKEAADYELQNWSAGADVLDLMGECYIDPSLIDYEIEEI